MEVREAVERRRSCRAFLDRPVDPTLVRDIVVRAGRAASGGNLQPWIVHVLTGEPLAALVRAVLEAIGERDPRDLAGDYAIYPEPLWEPFAARRRAVGLQLYAALGIGRADAEGRRAQFRHNFAFFGAPVGILVALDRRHGPPQWSDLGGYVATLMLLAEEAGLATCAQEAWTLAHRPVKEFLGMPETEMLFCGIALGHGDPDHPANAFRTARAAPDDWCRFHGFAADTPGGA